MTQIVKVNSINDDITLNKDGIWIQRLNDMNKN